MTTELRSNRNPPTVAAPSTTVRHRIRTSRITEVARIEHANITKNLKPALAPVVKSSSIITRQHIPANTNTPRPHFPKPISTPRFKTATLPTRVM